MDNDAQKKSADSAGKVLLYIIGENGFDNELLADFLKRQTGFSCLCLPLGHFKNIIGQSDENTRLILLDCSDLSAPYLWKLMNIDRGSGSERSLLLLTKVKAALKLEQQALDFGVRGILYATDDIALYPQAVKAVINEELWYPRRVLEARLMAMAGNSLGTDKEAATLLSKREREILALLASGLSNQTIADRMYISPHTVKTHAYNIYKKINVGSRLHAALWLSRN